MLPRDLGIVLRTHEDKTTTTTRQARKQSDQHCIATTNEQWHRTTKLGRKDGALALQKSALQDARCKMQDAR